MAFKETAFHAAVTFLMASMSKIFFLWRWFSLYRIGKN